MMAGEAKDMLEQAVGTKIEWKQGKDPTVKVQPCAAAPAPSLAAPKTKHQSTRLLAM